MIVYEFLSSNNLNAYYSLEKNPGRKIESVESRDKYIYLDQDEVKNKFLLFSNDEISKVSFSIPQIHCSSCIWLLENLGRLNDGITYSIVNFPKRVAEITYKNNSISLRELVELLDAIGYKPDLKAHRTSSKQYTSDKSLIY
ncbi:MAG: Cu+-exporting ATPase, partial [Parvicellaceae bacterium]